jgi:hypothetical protein
MFPPGTTMSVQNNGQDLVIDSIPPEGVPVYSGNTPPASPSVGTVWVDTNL